MNASNGKIVIMIYKCGSWDNRTRWTFFIALHRYMLITMFQGETHSKGLTKI